LPNKRGGLVAAGDVVSTRGQRNIFVEGLAVIPATASARVSAHPKYSREEFGIRRRAKGRIVEREIFLQPAAGGYARGSRWRAGRSYSGDGWICFFFFLETSGASVILVSGSKLSSGGEEGGPCAETALLMDWLNRQDFRVSRSAFRISCQKLFDHARAASEITVAANSPQYLAWRAPPRNNLFASDCRTS